MSLYKDPWFIGDVSAALGLFFLYLSYPTLNFTNASSNCFCSSLFGTAKATLVVRLTRPSSQSVISPISSVGLTPRKNPLDLSGVLFILLAGGCLIPLMWSFTNPV